MKYPDECACACSLQDDLLKIGSALVIFFSLCPVLPRLQLCFCFENLVQKSLLPSSYFLFQLCSVASGQHFTLTGKARAPATASPSDRALEKGATT